MVRFRVKVHLTGRVMGLGLGLADLNLNPSPNPNLAMPMARCSAKNLVRFRARVRLG